MPSGSNLGGEQWRSVVGFEGLYEVSDRGRVRSLSRPIRTAHGATKKHAGQVISPVPDRDGYPRVILRVDGAHYTRRVHRLVCEAFNGPPNALHRETHHVDADKANARADNLRWVSRGENLFLRRLPPPAPEKFSKLTADDVRSIRGARGELTAKQLADWYSISPYTVYDIWRRKRWSSLP